jgi:hypothetical protein
MADSFNKEGVLVGDTDMELGHLRFYPKGLALAQIEEIFKYGQNEIVGHSNIGSYGVLRRMGKRPNEKHLENLPIFPVH